MSTVTKRKSTDWNIIATTVIKASLFERRYISLRVYTTTIRGKKFSPVGWSDFMVEIKDVGTVDIPDNKIIMIILRI